MRDNGQATGNTSLQNAGSGPGLSADRRYLTLGGIDHLPNTSQPWCWQGATGSSLAVTNQQPIGRGRRDRCCVRAGSAAIKALGTEPPQPGERAGGDFKPG
jgi:hypothetical protein